MDRIVDVCSSTSESNFEFASRFYFANMFFFFKQIQQLLEMKSVVLHFGCFAYEQQQQQRRQVRIFIVNVSLFFIYDM